MQTPPCEPRSPPVRASGQRHTWHGILLAFTGRNSLPSVVLLIAWRS